MKKLSPAEPVTQLRHIPIRDNGEPLIDFHKECPDLLLDAPRFNYRRETYLRESVAKMICQANSATPKGYRLAIVEGWRPPKIQARMYAALWNRFRAEHPEWSETQMRRVVNRFTAPINAKVPPPHTTGGALDVFIVDAKGHPLDMHSPYKRRDETSFPHHTNGLSDAARKHREILRDALSTTALTNYPSEYWHWSYGDQGWAYRGGQEFALYNAIEPPGWKIAPEDDNQEPLVFINRAGEAQ